MDFKVVKIDIPEGCNIILGQSHFIKTIEDLYEIIATTVSNAKFGIAFSEASGPCLIRTEGNDTELIKACITNLQNLQVGHIFCILIKNAYPINILNAIKSCQEVCSIYCATANPLEIVTVSTEQGNGIVSIIDGFPPKGIELDDDKRKRKEFLRGIGYKL
ncbi:MAG: adenosine-specific kinase [Thermodesulfovibrionales bacterium]|nr:adenosine-specific kinase [Thermodesulfovibrionales bacterium]